MNTFPFCDIFVSCWSNLPPIHVTAAWSSTPPTQPTTHFGPPAAPGDEDANEYRRLRREHKARVSALVQQNSNFYRRQRMCECVTMMTVLVSFTAFR